MILYHTSNIVVTHPEIKFSRDYLDFGRGFYTTPRRSQAEKYAKRFFRENMPAFLNVYEWNESEMGYTRKIFEAYDGDWLDYVVLCRRELPHDLFDVIEGGIADDDVFNTLDLYMSELIDKKEAIKRLRKKRPNWQICFCNQNCIDSTMRYVESIELKENAQ